MRFRCARCGQRYSTAGQPGTAQAYRLSCLVCGGTVTLKGGDFPALPTSAPDPRPPAHADVIYEAAGEEPLGLALAPMAQLPPERAQGQPSPAAAPAPAHPTPRLRVAAGSAAALAALAGLFLLLRRPASEVHPAAARPATRTATVPGDALARSAGLTVAPRPSAESLASGAPAPAVNRAPGKPAPSPQPPPSPAARPPTNAPEASHDVPHTAPRLASAPDQRPGGSQKPGAAAAHGPPATGNAPEAHRQQDRVVLDTLAARRGALDACARDWARAAPWLWVSGRRVDLSLVVDPSGHVISCTLDDPDLDGTSLGACLRKVLGRPFPAFDGEPLHVRVPLRLGE